MAGRCPQGDGRVGEHVGRGLQRGSVPSVVVRAGGPKAPNSEWRLAPSSARVGSTQGDTRSPNAVAARGPEPEPEEVLEQVAVAVAGRRAGSRRHHEPGGPDGEHEHRPEEPQDGVVVRGGPHLTRGWVKRGVATRVGNEGRLDGTRRLGVRATRPDPCGRTRTSRGPDRAPAGHRRASPVVLRRC